MKVKYLTSFHCCRSNGEALLYYHKNIETDVHSGDVIGACATRLLLLLIRTSIYSP